MTRLIVWRTTSITMMITRLGSHPMCLVSRMFVSCDPSEFLSPFFFFFFSWNLKFSDFLISCGLPSVVTWFITINIVEIY
jgi:hypothetical protein